MYQCPEGAPPEAWATLDPDTKRWCVSGVRNGTLDPAKIRSQHGMDVMKLAVGISNLGITQEDIEACEPLLEYARKEVSRGAGAG